MNLIQVLGYQPTCYVCDGHGYDPKTGIATPGKSTPPMAGTGKPIYENQFNRATAEAFGKAAEAMGFRVVYVSAEAIDTPLGVRTERANEDFAQQRKKYPNVPIHLLAVYVSFHFNALNGVFDRKSGGVETLYYKGSLNGMKLAASIQKHLLQGTKQADRKIKPRDNLWVLEETHMTAVLVEAGFMDKLAEAQLMLSPAFQKETALDTLRGVCEYFGVPAEVEPPKPTAPEANSRYTAWETEGLAWLQSQLAIADSWTPDQPLTIGAFGTILKRYHDKYVREE